MKRDILARPTLGVACNYKASRVAPPAPKVTAGATTTRGFGWITDAGLSFQWAGAPVTKTVITRIAMTGIVKTETAMTGTVNTRIAMAGTVITDTVGTDNSRQLPVIPMMSGDILAQPTPAAACNCKASRVVPLVPRVAAGATTAGGFGWITDAAPLLQWGAITETADTEIADMGTTETDKSKQSPAIPMMSGDILAQPIPGAACNYKTNTAAHPVPRTTAGVTTTREFGWITDAVLILQ